MKFIDSSLAEVPVDVSNFTYFDSTHYPKIIIGTPIHHKYDQDRIKVSKEFVSENILYIQATPTIQARFFKGIPLTLASTFKHLPDDIENNVDPSNLLDSYNKLLSNYKLTCRESYSYLSKGIFPIDGKHLDIMTNNTYRITNLYNKFFDNPNHCFQCISGLSIFILTSSYISDEVYESLFKVDQASLLV